MNTPPPPLTSAHQRPAFFVGVEVGETIIRAGVYTETLRLVGKTKFSTKTERGPDAVISRIARCVVYAADECDLAMTQIRSIGVGIPGLVSPTTGTVIRSSALEWTEVPFQQKLEQELGHDVSIANSHDLAALGIYSQELPVAPRSFAALFLGAQITGGMIEGNQFKDPQESGIAHDPLERQQNIFGTIPHPLFTQFRSRDFRKALRKGNGEVRGFLLQIARKAGEVAADLVTRFQPETLAFGGGVLDELREEILQCAFDAARGKLGRELGERTTVLTSSLGDLAGIAGAARWAARTANPSHPLPSESVALDTVH